MKPLRPLIILSETHIPYTYTAHAVMCCPIRSLVADETTLALHAKKPRKACVISLNTTAWNHRIGASSPFLFSKPISWLATSTGDNDSSQSVTFRYTSHLLIYRYTIRSQAQAWMSCMKSSVKRFVLPDSLLSHLSLTAHRVVSFVWPLSGLASRCRRLLDLRDAAAFHVNTWAVPNSHSRDRLQRRGGDGRPFGFGHPAFEGQWHDPRKAHSNRRRQYREHSRGPRRDLAT